MSNFKIQGFNLILSNVFQSNVYLKNVYEGIGEKNKQIIKNKKTMTLVNIQYLLLYYIIYNILYRLLFRGCV